MVSDDGDGVCSSLEILMPFFQCQDYHEEFPVIDVIVALGRGESAGEVCAWVQVRVPICLHEYCSSG